MRIQDALRESARTINSDSARLDAEVLLAHIFQKPRSYLYAFSDRLLTISEQNRFQALVTRRQKGEPVAHLLGQREFWSLPLAVNAQTLIPRPESELLVELALQFLAERREMAPKVLDLGTGTGAIALAIASECPECRVVAVDRVAPAVELAERNRQLLRLTNVSVMESHWFESVSGTFDLIVSNPPYLPESDPHLLQGDVRFEPRSALTAGPEGLDDLVHIIDGAGRFLRPGGALIVEHGATQATSVRNVLIAQNYQRVFTRQDLAQLDRASGGYYGG